MKYEGRVEVCWTRVWGAQRNNMYKAAGKTEEGHAQTDGQGLSSSVSWAPVGTLGFSHSLVGSFLLIFNRV